METKNACRAWYEGDAILEAYHDHEWCKVNHDDQFQFEMLCLEGASVGLSWKTIMHKREAYREAFHGFDIGACAGMTDQELERVLKDPGIIRNRNKVFSVRSNAQAVQKIQAEFGSFDTYLWRFTDGNQIDGHWKTAAEMPTESAVSRAMRRAIKADDRLPFGELFFDGSFGKALGEGEALDFVPSLKMVQLAPSAANKQPWRAVVDGSKVHFYEASTMKESLLGDVQKVDIGIALAHFEMSMEEEGYAGRFVFEDPGLEAPAGVKYIVTYVKQED